METLQKGKGPIEFEMYYDQDREIFSIKVRQYDQDSLEKRGFVMKFTKEMLESRMVVVPEAECYPVRTIEIS